MCKYQVSSWCVCVCQCLFDGLVRGARRQFCIQPDLCRTWCTFQTRFLTCTMSSMQSQLDWNNVAILILFVLMICAQSGSCRCGNRCTCMTHVFAVSRRQLLLPISPVALQNNNKNNNKNYETKQGTSEQTHKERMKQRANEKRMNEETHIKKEREKREL